MQKLQNLQIIGKIAEIVDSNNGRFVTVMANNTNLRFEFTEIMDISLGDTVIIKGNMLLDSINVNGIEKELVQQ